MPSGNLPASGYLGDGQRTTSEFQGGIDELLAYVRSLKAEVDTLSDTVLREAAVRGVGDGAGLVPDKAVLDARLGTTGSLTETIIYDVTPEQAMATYSPTEGAELPSPLTDGLYEALYIYSEDSGTTYNEYSSLFFIRRSSLGSDDTKESSAIIVPAGIGSEVLRILYIQFTENFSGDIYIYPRCYDMPDNPTSLINLHSNTGIRKITKLAATGA